MQENIAKVVNEAVKTADSGITRRNFLTLAGSGLFVFFCAGPLEALQEPARLPSTNERPWYPKDFNAYLHIAPDGRVTCLVGKVELGQGAMTSLPMLLADELEVPLASVDIIMGDTDLCPWDMGTFGSLSTRHFGPILKTAAAEARTVLVQMAAERFNAPAERLRVKEGVVSDPAQGKQVTYAELVQGKRIERHIEKAALKPVSQYTVHGQSPARRDALEKVSGKAKYAGDIIFPGMLSARFVRPPSHDSKFKSVDTSAAEKIPDLRVIKEGDMIAVLHEHRDVADKARDLIKAQHDTPQPTVDDKTIFDHLLKTAPKPAVVAEQGNIAEGEKLASSVVELTYLNSYVAHSPMETHSATAKFDADGKLTVWASTQTPYPLKQQLMHALSLPADKVRVIVPYVGGGFGGKSASQQAIEAAKLAKLTGKPVQVVWDRAEEFFYDEFRPAAVLKIRAGLSSAGKITSWQFDIVGAGDREAQHFYDIPHHRTTSAGGWMGGNPAGMNPFAVGAWRAPSVNSNTFARESHIDMLAAKAGVDPVEFRLAHLSDKRMIRVLESAAKQFGWKPAKAPSGRGVGVALAIYSGTYTATMAEVEVDKKTGHVQVKRVVTAQDQGVTVNPDGSRQQIEGSVTMGMGYALTEELQFKGSQALTRNFDTYEIPRFSWLPKLETILIDNPEVPACGCGEPPIVTIGAVLANAIFDATGARVLQLPMTPEHVKSATKVRSS